MTEESKSIKLLLRENQKVLFFLLRFLGVFGILTLSYHAWIDRFAQTPDSFSWIVAKNIKSLYGSEVHIYQFPGHPVVSIDYVNKVEAISIYEGCNGLAIMIMFLAFIAAFKGKTVDYFWFIPLGILTIHIFNLLRLILLMHLSESGSPAYHFMHKYLFSLIIYAVVFGLWVIWVKRSIRTKN